MRIVLASNKLGHTLRDIHVCAASSIWKLGIVFERLVNKSYETVPENRNSLMIAIAHTDPLVYVS